MDLSLLRQIGSLVLAAGACLLAGKIFAAHRRNGFAASPLCPFWMPAFLLANAVSFAVLPVVSIWGRTGKGTTLKQQSTFDYWLLLAAGLLVARLALIPLAPQMFGGLSGVAPPVTPDWSTERPWQIILGMVAGAIDLAVVTENLWANRGGTSPYAAWIIGFNKGVLVTDVNRLLAVCMFGGSVLKNAGTTSTITVLYVLWGLFAVIANSASTLLLMSQRVTGLGYCVVVAFELLGIFVKTGVVDAMWTGEPWLIRKAALACSAAIPVGVIYNIHIQGEEWWADRALESRAE